uniref:Toxin-like peptide n=1 Tax=Grammostola rosea TaxID=432528 RepID=H7CEL7_GRARO|nr:toxin-like peptide [Grammostola rosea]
MRSLTLAVILACSLLLVFHTAAEELEAQEDHLMIPSDTDSTLETLDDERIFECVMACDIEKDGEYVNNNKPCKPKKEQKCTGGWRCKLKLCLKV